MFKWKIDVGNAARMFDKLQPSMEKSGTQSLKDWGNHAVKSVLRQANRVGIDQFRRSRSMFTSTRWVQNQKTGYMLMPMSGIYQDRAKPHYVSVTRNKPMLNAWARQKGFTGSGFYFTRKPFIKVGLRNARNRLKPTLRSYIRKNLREVGRI